MSCVRNNKTKELRIANGISLTIVDFSTLIGEINAVIPTISEIFNKFEPIILPREIPSEFERDAEILTAASGELVPKATIVRPIIIGGIFKYFDILAEPDTNKSAPLINIMKPVNSNKYDIIKPPKNKRPLT
jgi:hypothetical protein